jgi:hypothetical protein
LLVGQRIFLVDWTGLEHGGGSLEHGGGSFVQFNGGRSFFEGVVSDEAE